MATAAAAAGGSVLRFARACGVLREQQKKDILVGYHMQECVVADGEILCGTHDGEGRNVSTRSVS
ncbi:MAG: hypothetical protein ACLUAR_16970 [Pilosibacter sp.]